MRKLEIAKIRSCKKFMSQVLYIKDNIYSHITYIHIYVQLEGFTKVNPFIELINGWFCIIIIQLEGFTKVIPCSAYGNTAIALFGFEHSMCL